MKQFICYNFFLNYHHYLIVFILETTLKMLGCLPLTFAIFADYDKVQPTDRISIIGLTSFTPGTPLTAILRHKDGSKEEIVLNHSFNKGI